MRALESNEHDASPVEKVRSRPIRNITKPRNSSVSPIKRGRGRPPNIPASPAPPVKRGRGRPPKIHASPAPPVKRGRGRPPKIHASPPVKRGPGRPPKKQKQREQGFDIAAVAEEESPKAPTTLSPSEPELLSRDLPSLAIERTSSASMTLPTTETLQQVVDAPASKPESASDNENHAGPEQSCLTKSSHHRGPGVTARPEDQKQVRFIGVAAEETPEINGESIR
ncbi:hypothetical protein XANCAGTX0491_010001 [Xanthoria calcicola]